MQDTCLAKRGIKENRMGGGGVWVLGARARQRELK